MFWNILLKFRDYMFCRKTVGNLVKMVYCSYIAFENKMTINLLSIFQKMDKKRRIDDYKRDFMAPEHLEALKEHFCVSAVLGPGSEASLLKGGEDNINLVLRDASGVPRFVARHYLISSPSKVAAEIRLVSMLVEYGYPTPPPIGTVTRGFFLDRGDEPSIALFPYIEGEVTSSWSLEQKRKAAAAIAWMHNICIREGYRIAVTKPRLETIRSGPAKIAALGISGHEALTVEIATFLSERLEPELMRLESLPSGPVHHDLNYGNVIWRGEEIEAIIDFDECHDAPLVMDLAAAFSYLALDMDYRLEAEPCIAIIEGYERERRLSEEERLLLPLAWDLLNLTSGVEFIIDNSDWLTATEECRSYTKLYLHQKGRMEAIVAGLST
jgi:homoserine kinase type II